MIRALLRTVLIVIVLVAVGAFLLGYRLNGTRVVRPADRPVGTSGTLPKIDTGRARDAGAAIGEKVAAGANEAERVLTDAGLTAKIKSKMALDDTVKARSIDVTTSSGVVTLTGTVDSEAERLKAVQLAKETQGVTSVTDRLRVR